MKNKTIKYVLLILILICLSVSTPVLAFKDQFSWNGEVAVFEEYTPGGGGTTKKKYETGTVINNADELCSYDFKHYANPNINYSKNINTELAIIQKFYMSCQRGATAGVTKRCYEVNENSNPDSSQTTCPTTCTDCVTWDYPVAVGGSVDDMASCMNYLKKSYELIANTYCPSDNYKVTEEQCKQCASQFPGWNFDQDFTETAGYSKEFCRNISATCQNNFEHKDDTQTYCLCVKKCGDSDNNSCVNACKEQYKDLEDTTKNCFSGDGSSEDGAPKPNIVIGHLSCESLAELTAFVGKIYRIIMIVLVVGLVILSMADYGKAVMSSDQDLMKKANKHIVIRIIIVATFILLPFIIETVIKLFLSGTYPDIDACLKF